MRNKKRKSMGIIARCRAIFFGTPGLCIFHAYTKDPIRTKNQAAQYPRVPLTITAKSRSMTRMNDRGNLVFKIERFREKSFEPKMIERIAGSPSIRNVGKECESGNKENNLTTSC